MLNRVILIGRLAADPEMRYTQSGVPTASFRLAVERPYVNEQGERPVDFLPIVVYRGQAEACANNLSKGRLVAVEGRIQTRSFQGQDGSTRWVTEIVADSVRFLDYPREQQAAPQPAAVQAQAANNLDYSSAEPLPDDHYPF